MDNNGHGDHSLFRIEPGVQVTFDGLILRDGRIGKSWEPLPHAGAVLNYGTAVVVNSQFLNNEAYGGYGDDGATGADGTDAGDAAGAIYNAGTLSVTGSTFSGNSGDAGEGGSGGDGANASGFLLATAGGNGGAGGNAAGSIFNAAGAVLTLGTTYFELGHGGRGGGGDGGKGGSGAFGRNGGNGGDAGFADCFVMNFGTVSGDATANIGGSGVGLNGPGPAAPAVRG